MKVHVALGFKVKVTNFLKDLSVILNNKFNCHDLSPHAFLFPTKLEDDMTTICEAFYAT